MKQIMVELADTHQNVTLSFKTKSGGSVVMVMHTDQERLARVLAILQAPPDEVLTPLGLKVSDYE